MLKPMKNTDIKLIKEILHKENKGICPLLQIEVSPDKMVLDHIHKLKSESPSENKGTIRNAIEFRANAMEGKITNNWKRYFGSDDTKHPITLSNYLRNLADYLDKGAYIDCNGDYYIHPSEVVKEPKLGKREFNKINKSYIEKYPKKKPLEFPKSGKWTKQLLELKAEFS